jgi:TROVE domain
VKQIVKVVTSDPEFPLKLALHLREDCKIRTTPAFIISLCAHIRPCQGLVKFYFPRICRTPSDLVDILRLYRTVPNRTLSARSFPHSLRRCAEDAFASFDQYQLAKHCSPHRARRRAVKSRKRQARRGSSKKSAQTDAKTAAKTENTDVGEPQTMEEWALGSSYSMKSVVRDLHLRAPRENVLRIQNQKYPASAEVFAASGLPGKFQVKKKKKKRAQMRIPIWFRFFVFCLFFCFVLFRVFGSSHSFAFLLRPFFFLCS